MLDYGEYPEAVIFEFKEPIIIIEGSGPLQERHRLKNLYVGCVNRIPKWDELLCSRQAKLNFYNCDTPKGKLLVRGYFLASFWSSARAALRAISRNPFAVASFLRAMRRVCPAVVLPDDISVSPSAKRAFN